MKVEIKTYNEKQATVDKVICNLLATTIDKELPNAENKIWHSHPVWFLDGNPIVGYSKQKAGIRLMFWSGADFQEDDLNIRGEKFKDASILYNNASEIETKDLKNWLKKSIEIQWDYKNIVKRKGKLERIKISTPSKKTLRTCKNGHQYYKSSDCPTCPTCEEGKRPKDGFLSLLYAPARRALVNANIKTIKQLSTFSETDILKLHGIGKTTIPILKRELEKARLKFND